MTLNLFFSWQMETDLQGFNNKSFLIDCLEEAVELANKQLKGVQIKFHEGMRDSSGTGPVAAEMFRQINECHIFVGDMTIVQRLCERAEFLRNKKGLYFRYSPNCNVYGEFNRALGKHVDFWKQSILLMNDANRSVCDDKDVIPFDTRELRWPIIFSLKDDSEESKRKEKQKLLKVLPDNLVRCAREALNHIDCRYKPFISWHTQNGYGGQKRFDDVLVINKYKDEVLKSNRVICILGPTGTRKTTLIHKVFEDEPYCNDYLYVDSADDDIKSYKDALCGIFQTSQNTTVVIDNSNSQDLLGVLKWRRRHNAGNRIVLLMDHNIEQIPELAEYKYVVIDANTDLVKELNQNLEDKGVLSEVFKSKVRTFCQNDNQYVSLIAATMTGGEAADEFEGARLTSRLSGYAEGTIERTIMQSLSLFEFIGFKDDRRVELEFILTNKHITSLREDNVVIINTAAAIIKAGIKRGTFVVRGRTISITPRSMANQLIQEWLDSVDENRFLEVLASIESSPYKERLMQELHDRFKYLGTSAEAVAIVERILKTGSVFEKMEVLNTNEGAMLLEGFAQVNPNAVNNLLARVLNSMTQDQLMGLDNGRRYLVWTLDKLCFRSDTFRQSAALMLRLANAENEHISNNATGQFIGLFPVMLPATETNLSVRLEFLKEQFELNQNRTVLMSALKRALTYRDFILFGGAETMGDKKLEPYKPKSYAEIAYYFEGCLGILVNEVNSLTEYEAKVLEILEDTVISLCDGGFASLILPVIDNIAKQRDYDWGKMQHTLSFFYWKVKESMNPEDRSHYEAIVQQLTKMDPVSRFLRVEKESFYTEDGLREGYEKRMEKNKETFEALAYELYDKHLLDKDTLCKLICSENISTYPFGSTLAKRMTKEEQASFVHDMIDAINDCEKPSIDILCQFISEIDDEVFVNLIPELKRSKITYTLFACIGIRNIKPGEDLFKNLRELVEMGNANVEDYHQYWTRLNIGQMTEVDCIRLFDEIISFNGGFAIVLKMSFFLLMDKKILQYRKLADFMTVAFLKYKEGPVIVLNLALNNAEALLRAYDYPELASRINEEILGYARASHTSFSHNYELEVIYRLLMGKYFNVIWPALSQQLLADGEEFMAYYNLKWFLGVDMVDNDKPIINEGNHFDEMKPWLEAHLEIAPARLASLILVADEQGEFTTEAMFLIDHYGKDRNVLTELGCSLNSFASVGSVLPQYEHRKNVYSKLLNHKFEEVRIWAQSEVNSCEYMIAYEGNREQEKI